MGRPESAELGVAQPVGRLPLAGLLKGDKATTFARLLKGHKATAFARLLKGHKATAWPWQPDRLLTWTSLACGQLPRSYVPPGVSGGRPNP